MMMVPIMIVFFLLVVALPIAMGFVLAASIVALLWMLVVRAASYPLRWWRARRPLPDSWWDEFERDLEAYSTLDLVRARQRERRL